MAEFRKKLSIQEIESGAICWNEAQDEELRAVIPQTLVFDMVFEDSQSDNLSVEWEKRRLFIGEPVASAIPDSEIVLMSAKDQPTIIKCCIFAPKERIIIRKRLSHQEHSRKCLKWFAREDDLYQRLFAGLEEEFVIDVAQKKILGRVPELEKRKIFIGDPIRLFNPGDDLLIHWDSSAEVPTLIVTKEELATKVPSEGITSLRSLVARLLSRPLTDFNEGEVKGLIVLLDENKKLWEKLSNHQEENRRLKEQVNMLEALFEQFASNSFFSSKKEFEQWVTNHVNTFEKGLRLLHRNYSVTFSEGRKRRIDLLCQDKKGVLVAVQILFRPDAQQTQETLELMQHLRSNIEAFSSELTGGQFRAADVRGLIIADQEKAELVEFCMENRIKLCLIKSGCLIDVLE
jgi:hypothetical protein